MQKQNLKGTVYILLATVIWGSTFVAQSSAQISPFTFQGMRNAVGALFLVLLSLVLDKSAKKRGTYKKMTKSEFKTLLFAGTVCGVVLFCAMNLQQFGIYYGTGAGKAGFITAMYMLIVPVFGFFLGKKVPKNVLFAIAIALVGLFLLCMSDTSSLGFSKGDLMVLACSFAFAVHIMLVDHFAPNIDGVKLSLVQFVVSGILSCICMLSFEEPSLDGIKLAIGEILFAGIGSSGIAYTLQILGQKYTSPTVASIVMSFESVFAMLCEVVVFLICPTFAGGSLSLPTAPEVLGCVLMFIAIFIAQKPEKKNNDCVTEK